jgi:hypothetical protein
MSGPNPERIYIEPSVDDRALMKDQAAMAVARELAVALVPDGYVMVRHSDAHGEANVYQARPARDIGAVRFAVENAMGERFLVRVDRVDFGRC